jgi:signal transduction histidine kinase/CheY-like chemotaxis protein
MSKKPAPSRLNKLFNEFDQKSVPAPDEKEHAMLPGWAWEVSADGHFISCGPEVEAGLGHPASEWIGQSLYHFGISIRSLPILQNALRRGIFPVEIDLEYQDVQKNIVLIRVNIFAHYDDNGQISGWRGFNQVLSRVPTPPLHPTGALILRDNLPPTGPLSTRPGQTLRGGVAYQDGKTSPADKPWTEAAPASLSRNETITQVSKTANAAAMVVPFQLSGQSKGLIEILDNNINRHWSEDDLMLAQDIARQLALALENAELYATVQQELSERVRAEKETLRRNQELSLLNQVGQQLSKLTSRQELLNLVQKSIGEMVDHRNLTIALYNSITQTISFPVNTLYAEVVALPEKSLDKSIVGYLLTEKHPLLLGEKIAQALQEHDIEQPDPLPLSLLGIPMLAGERPVGAIVVQDFEHEKAYTNVDAELLSTIAAQATTALENTNLFQEITNALQALETRERYQANIAKSVAILTQFGTLALPDVLSTIAVASRSSRIYYATVGEDESGPFWQLLSEWRDPGFNGPQETDKTPMPISLFPHWVAELRGKGWATGTILDAPTPEREYLTSHGIASILLLAVPGKNTYPNFLAFEQLDYERKWIAEEINVLRVATDAISNTIVREDLLEQLQVSLDETENLYNASHRLALANDLQEMVSAITVDMHAPSINRGVLVLFDYDPQGKVNRISVAANWYSGNGTPPLAIGLEYPRAVYEHLFFTQASSFIDDIFDTPIDSSLRDILAQQNIRSIAILPLWASKYQLGVLLLESEVKHQFTGRETRSYPPLVDQMATTIENLKLFEQTQSALAETGLLYQISSGIAQANNPEALIKLISNQMMLPKNADRATLFMANQTPDGTITEYEIVGDYNSKQGSGSVGVKIPAADLPVFKSTYDVMALTDLQRSDLDPASKQTLSRYNIQSICLIPLRTAGRTVGFLTTTANRSIEFGKDEIRVLQVASGGFAVALERYRLLNEAQRRALELQTAAEIARDTTGTLAIDQLLSRIVNLLKERFNFYHVSIYLLDETGSFAVVREASGEAGQELKKRGYKLAVGSRSIIGSIMASGTRLAVADTSQSNIYFSHPLFPNTQAEIGIPLKAGDKVIGALDLQYDRANAFTQDDVSVLQILADQIAVAIENAKAYELAQKAYEEIKEVDRVKSQFLANMSHELRTPLNSIIGFSRVILKGIDGPINETQKQDLSAIYNSGQHLLTLINNILDLSKIEAGKMELQISDVSIADMVNSVMSTATGLVKDKAIKLYQQIPPDLPTVKADQTRVRQILLNFVSNATKFTEEGSITVGASVITGPKGRKEVMVTIADTGNGIAPEDQGKLFQPFSQVDDSPTRKTGGTGLGLSICRSMVEMHGGRIGLLNSEVGKGSTFFFTLPLAQEEVIIEMPPENTNVILAIDDDAQVISLYERYLKPQGYQVIALTNPREAVERAKQLKPYAITLDIMMPEVDGWQVLQQLKNDPGTRDIPIVICSILEDEEKGYNLGAADYLVKPFLQEDLINTINRVNKNGQIHQILVIDDDPKDARLVQKMLEDSGKFQVVVADGGKNGWDAMVSKRPDIVILDLFMPDMDGFTVLGNMRSSPQLMDLPVIVLTGADLTVEQHAQMVKLGQHYLTKGLLRERELLNTLDVALRKIRE